MKARRVMQVLTPVVERAAFEPYAVLMSALAGGYRDWYDVERAHVARVERHRAIKRGLLKAPAAWNDINDDGSKGALRAPSYNVPEQYVAAARAERTCRPQDGTSLDREVTCTPWVQVPGTGSRVQHRLPVPATYDGNRRTGYNARDTRPYNPGWRDALDRTGVLPKERRLPSSCRALAAPAGRVYDPVSDSYI